MPAADKIRLWSSRNNQMNHKLIKAFFAAQGVNPNVDARVSLGSMKALFVGYGEMTLVGNPTINK